MTRKLCHVARFLACVLGSGCSEVSVEPPPPDTTIRSILCKGFELGGITNASSIVVDGPDVFIADGQMGSGEVVRTDVACSAHAVLADFIGSPHSLAVDDQHVYWSEERELRRVPRSGGDWETVFDGDVFDEDAFDGFYNEARRTVLDGEFIYHVNGGKVLRIPKAGGPPEIMLEPGCGTSGVAVDDLYVYVAARFGCGNGDIVRVPKSGGGIEVIAVKQFTSDLVVDDANVYWTSSLDALTAWPKTGGVGRVYNAVKGSGSLALDASSIYYAAELHFGAVAKGSASAPVESVGYPANAVAVDEQRVFAAYRDQISIHPKPTDLEVSEFPTGDAQLTLNWTAECFSSRPISVLLVGPSSLNASVPCADMTFTFEDLAPGTYSFVAKHPDIDVSWENPEIEVVADTIVDGIDLLSPD